MRFVLCDDDGMIRSLVETVIARRGHEVVGIAETTVDGANLVRAARPDVLVVDLSLGINTDFDVIEAAISVQARTVVFSFNADHALLERYWPRPTVVEKPDLAALEQCIDELGSQPAPTEPEPEAAPSDRRVRPVRAANGPVPTGVGDASAFYEALNNAVEGDALVSIDLGLSGADWEWLGGRVAALIRTTDRLLASPTSVRVFLAGGDADGGSSLIERLRTTGEVAADWVVRSIVVAPGEAPADAFARLKHA